MGKRSDFPRRDRDFYPTPYEAVIPLLPHIGNATFDEPCVGNGALLTHLGPQRCGFASDIEPKCPGGAFLDALKRRECNGDYFITNPPWPQKQGEPTVAIALHLSSIAPTWLLLSADFCHNRYFSKLSDRCVKIVSVGRVSWEGNGIKGKDNCAWYLFDATHKGEISFYGRAA